MFIFTNNKCQEKKNLLNCFYQIFNSNILEKLKKLETKKLKTHFIRQKYMADR